MQGLRRFASSCSAALALFGCSPATTAAFIPRLDVSVRSTRTEDAYASFPSQRGQQRWDLTVLGRLAWTSQRSAALIPSRNELSPDTWIDPCPDQECFWDNPEDDGTASPQETP